jgi:integrase
LSVHENAVQLGVDHGVGATKGRVPRSVRVPEFVLDQLSVQRRDKGPADLVFTGSAGGHLPRPKSTGGWFAAAIRCAGVQPITPHDYADLGVMPIFGERCCRPG